MASQRHRVLDLCWAFFIFGILTFAWWSTPAPAAQAEETPPAKLAADVQAALQKVPATGGICVVLGADRPSQVAELAAGSKLVVYFQSPAADQVAAVRQSARAAGLLGTRVFVDQGDLGSIHLADNLADAVFVSESVKSQVARDEVLRVLHPEGKAVLGDEELVKPAAEGIDAWSHLYHGPDNNTQSEDQLARAPYLTQFLAGPMFSPMPEVTVAAGGRIFKAMGHIAHKANQNAMLNTLLGINGYNGEILWQREVPKGFMIHRSTMIATPDVLYLGDMDSCKLIDARTGQVKSEIVIPDRLADGPVWKWMALKDGVLYALIGSREIEVDVQPSDTPGLGHWPWGMWQGHEYADPKTNFGFGRTLVAIDPSTKQILWTRQEEEFLDSRGVCMNGSHIFYYSPDKFLACLEAKTGNLLWKTVEPAVLEAIGPNGAAQLYVTGYATQTYIKCNDNMIFFAGPQRERLVAISAEDGKLLWQRDYGNLQLVLRKDAIYGAGPEQTGCVLAYDTGAELAKLPTRRACTRATGTVDSILYRTTGGTMRIDLAANVARHIAPMRPPCQDGVIVSDGLLYWGPWMCGCQLSLYGHVCLGSAGKFDFHPAVNDARLETGADAAAVQELKLRQGDWPCYGADNQLTSTTQVAMPEKVKLRWTYRPPSQGRATAPVTAGGLVFVGDESGAVRALDADGKLRWEAATGGAVFFPPAVWRGRVYAGSADGRVYAFEAATGRRLWCFRAAPAERFIPVYGKLMSTWPVAGGVVVDHGVVYAAAGIAQYDGTYVYALDAVTGRPKWCNDSSGDLSTVTNSGVSLQGNLYLHGKELCFSGGNVHQVARYDLATGKCLNEPNDVPRSGFQTAFYPYFPVYGQYVSLEYPRPDGNMLNYLASYEGSQHTRLALLGPNQPRPANQPAAQRKAPNRRAIWEEPRGRVFNGFIVSPEVLVAAGQTSFTGPNRKSFLAAVNIADGKDLWYEELPAAAVKGGLATNHEGHVLVSLEDGRVLCYAAGR